MPPITPDMDSVRRLFVVCCLLFVVCCLLFVVCCLSMPPISVNLLALPTTYFSLGFLDYRLAELFGVFEVWMQTQKTPQKCSVECRVHVCKRLSKMAPLVQRQQMSTSDMFSRQLSRCWQCWRPDLPLLSETAQEISSKYVESGLWTGHQC